MIAIVFMMIVTMGSIFILVETGRAGKAAAAEIVMSKGWSNRFARKVWKRKRQNIWKRMTNIIGNPLKRLRRKSGNGISRLRLTKKKRRYICRGNVFPYWM